MARTIFAGMVLLVSIAITDVAAQSGALVGAGSKKAPAILGMWRVSTVAPFADDDECDRYFIVTAKGYGVITTTGSKPNVAGAVDADADELRAAWGQWLQHAGTYVLHADNQLALHPIIAGDPLETEGWINLVYKLDGDSLVLRDKDGRATRLARVSNR